MLRFVVRRLLLLLPILCGVSVLVFAWVHKLPGGPAESLLGERATPQLVREYRERYGLDKPLPVQYVKYVKELAVDAIIQADWGAFVDAVKHLVLPAVALGSIPLAIVTRITRAAVLDVQNEDYVRTARAKGLAPLIVDRRHILRNALLPISTIIGLQTGLLLSGAVLTETVFAYPGMGSWLRDAIFNRDYAVLQGGIMFLALVFVFVNLLVDISYAVINPRIRYS